MAKVLTPEQVEQYDREGFVYPLRALSEASAGALRNRIEAFEKEQACEAQQALAFKAHLPFSWLSDVITNPIILDAVEDILGPNLLCWGSSFFQKNANDPRFVSWHQDTYYYGLEPPETLTVWLSITHSNSESGCVRVVPGSHRNQKVLAFDNIEHKDNLLTRGQTIVDVDEDAAIPMVLRPGEFSMHHEAVVHGSDPNKSDDRRIGLSIHYIPTNVRRVKYNQPNSMPKAALVRGKDEYGHWEHERLAVADFEPKRLEELIALRREFLSRSRKGTETPT